MKFEHYTDQIREWPQDGRHLLAQYDDDSIVVYQAYRPSIAEYAVKHQRFGGDFSFTRMSWIKPNFLWMMFRAGWATKEGQERILAVSIRRTFFERILECAVASSFAASGYADEAEWKKAIENSDVRLQWDPDHDPFGHPIARRAVQLGLRGETLAEYGSAAITAIEDMTPSCAISMAMSPAIARNSSRRANASMCPVPRRHDISASAHGHSSERPTYQGSTMENDTVTLYRPTGPQELELVRQSGFKRWPPRLPEQPIFYPVTNEAYAKQIATEWNVPDSGVGYVTRFAVRKSFMDRYAIQKVGGDSHTEWWIPAEDLEELNDSIVGEIEVIGEYRARS